MEMYFGCFVTMASNNIALFWDTIYFNVNSDIL